MSSGKQAGVYRCYGADGELLYIGATSDLARRLRDRPRDHWWPDVARITEEWHPTAPSAFAAERLAITAEQPRYNIDWKTGAPAPRRVRAARGAPPAIVGRELNSGTLKVIRRLLRLTKAQMAERTGCTPDLMRALLLGHGVPEAKDPEIQQRIAAGLGVSADGITCPIYQRALSG